MSDAMDEGIPFECHQLPDVIICACGLEAVQRTCGKGDNIGCRFWCCSRSQDDVENCRFFEWIDQPKKQPRKNILATTQRPPPKKRPVPQSPSGQAPAPPPAKRPTQAGQDRQAFADSISSDAASIRQAMEEHKLAFQEQL